MKFNAVCVIPEALMRESTDVSFYRCRVQGQDKKAITLSDHCNLGNTNWKNTKGKT